MSRQKKSSSRGWWIVGLIVLVLAALGWYGGWFTPETKTVIKGAKVERGPLTISVLQRGNLAAKDAVSIKSELEGQVTILGLIKEGTFVKPGDLLVELDASDLVERKVAQDISVQNAEASFTKAQASFDIQESQNESDIEAAKRKLTFAEIDSNKYLEGDFLQMKKAAEEEIVLAQAERAKSLDTFEWSTKLSDRGFLTKSELDSDKLDYQRAEISLEQAKRELDLLTKYDDVRRRAELKANLSEAERGLERAKLQAASRLVDYESGLATSKSKLDLEKEKLQKYEDQISKARIVAKDSGMVVYSRSEGGGRMGGGGDPIQEGTQVRERQEILTIPKTNGIIVEASVHESVLKRVSVGNRCKIRADAIPEREFDGVVGFVALLADKNSWWANPNQRLYRTEIQVTDPAPEMRPGMSVSIDILSDTIADCLSVPMQAIVLDKGKPTVFVTKGSNVEQRDVKVGRSNDAKVEVLEGLVEGEEVLLAPPVGFTPTGADEPQKVDPNPARPNAMPGMNGSGAPEGMGAPASARGGENRPAGASDAAPTAGGGEPGASGTPRAGAGARRGQGGDSSGRRRGPPGDGSTPKEGESKSADSKNGGTPEKQAESGGTPGGQRD